MVLCSLMSMGRVVHCESATTILSTTTVLLVARTSVDRAFRPQYESGVLKQNLEQFGCRGNGDDSVSTGEAARG